jgi:transcriptional regulator with XRE-family HTH domain
MVKLARLKELRTKQFLSIRELAEKAGVSPTTVAEIESKGRDAHPRTVRKLADALGVAPDELLGAGND